MAVDLARQIVSDIEQIVDVEVGEYLKEVQIATRRTYLAIVDHPVQITAYYRSNHSIVVRGPGGQFKTQGARLSPGVKESEERGFYSDNVDARVAEELAKLVEIALGDTVEIRTIVPYAESVEQNHNVYGAATAFGFEQTE
jgi:hypothetical protein